MTSLNTHIPIEYVKKCPKLQRFNMIRRTVKDDNNSVLSIADIIDNAEELFDKSLFIYRGVIIPRILDKCFDNKSIKEISEYIISNIKL